MKQKDKQELRNADPAALSKKAAELRQKLAELSVSRYTSPAKNTRERKLLRYQLSVVLTYLAEKEQVHG